MREAKYIHMSVYMHVHTYIPGTLLIPAHFQQLQTRAHPGHVPWFEWEQPPRGSQIWNLVTRSVLFEKICRCVLLGGSVSWEQALKFQKLMPSPGSLSLSAAYGVELSATSPACLPKFHHVSCQDDNRLNLWNSNPAPIIFFLARVAAASAVPSQQENTD